MSDVLEQLKEPTSGGEASIPWIGETEIKEHITRVCAQGKITINVLGRDMLERRAGESEDDAWQRMKGRLGNGRQLEETTIHEPGASISSGGSTLSRPHHLSRPHLNRRQAADLHLLLAPAVYSEVAVRDRERASKVKQHHL